MGAAARARSHRNAIGWWSESFLRCAPRGTAQDRTRDKTGRETKLAREDGGDRTLDPQIRSLMRYPLRYALIIESIANL